MSYERGTPVVVPNSHDARKRYHDPTQIMRKTSPTEYQGNVGTIVNVTQEVQVHTAWCNPQPRVSGHFTQNFLQGNPLPRTFGDLGALPFSGLSSFSGLCS